jgi:hypothetical protein
MNEFEVGEVVICKYNRTFDICVVKEVIPLPKRRARKEDGLYGIPTGEEYVVYSYRVWDYTNNKLRLTDDVSLYKISNKDAFTIKKKRRKKGDEKKCLKK